MIKSEQIPNINFIVHFKTDAARSSLLLTGNLEEVG